MADDRKYLDLDGLEVFYTKLKEIHSQLVSNAKGYSDNIVGSLKEGETTYTSMREYVDSKSTDLSNYYTKEEIETILDNLGYTIEIIENEDGTQSWIVRDSTIVHEDELLYEAGTGLLIDGVVNTTYTDDNTETGCLITTGASGSFPNWNITGMDLSRFRAIRFICVRDTANTGGTWVCDVPMNYAIQKTDDNPDGFFVSSGQVSSFGDRNRWDVVQCGVKGDKSSISIGQVFSLYGTAATTVSDIKIVAVYGTY